MKQKITAVFLAILMLLPIMGAAAETEFDWEHANIAVMTGSTGELFMMENYPNTKRSSFSSAADAIAALNADKVDAMVTANINAMVAIRTNPDLYIDGSLLTETGACVAVEKGNTALLKQVDSAIDQIRTQGILDEMNRRWVTSNDQTPANIPMVEQGEVLRVGTIGTRVSLSFIDANGKIEGYCPELALRIGQIINRKIEFVIVEFSALIPALKSGKIDMILDMMSYTEERATQVDFSQAYFLDGQVLFRKHAASQSDMGFLDSVKQSFQLNLVKNNRWLTLINGLGVTLLITVCAFIWATLLGLALCYFKRSKRKTLNWFYRVYSTVIRGTPMVVILMVTFYIIFAKVAISPIVVAVIAFGLNSGAGISVILDSAMDTVDRGQGEAAYTMGFTKFETLMTIVMPQAIKVAFPTYKSEFISLFKGTAIVGYIAIVDLTKAGDFIRSQTFDAFFPLIVVALMYMLMIALIVRLFDWLFKLTDKRGKQVA